MFTYVEIKEMIQKHANEWTRRAETSVCGIASKSTDVSEVKQAVGVLQGGALFADSLASYIADVESKREES